MAKLAPLAPKTDHDEGAADEAEAAAEGDAARAGAATATPRKKRGAEDHRFAVLIVFEWKPDRAGRAGWW